MDYIPNRLRSIPERERRCIFEDVFVGDDFGAATALSDGVADDIVRCYDGYYTASPHPAKLDGVRYNGSIVQVEQWEGQ